jgi:hypothetical protein
MKTESNHIPETILPQGGGKFHFNFNVQEITEGETTSYEYGTVEVQGAETYENIVQAFIRSEVSETEEFALVNKYNRFILGLSIDEIHQDNYVAFLNRVDEIKALVKTTLNIE